MFGRIDVGRAVVIAHIMQAGRRDCALEKLQRRARRSGDLAAGRYIGDENALDVVAPMRGHAIAVELSAAVSSMVGGEPAPMLSANAGRNIDRRRASQRRPALQEKPAVQKTVAGNRLTKNFASSPACS